MEKFQVLKFEFCQIKLG